MAEDRDREIPRAEQEAAMEGAPGYGTAMLAVAVIVFITVLLFAMIYILMAAIRPIEARDGKRARPAVEAPTTPVAPSRPPTAAPLQTVPLPEPPPPR